MATNRQGSSNQGHRQGRAPSRRQAHATTPDEQRQEQALANQGTQGRKLSPGYFSPDHRLGGGDDEDDEEPHTLH